MKSEIFFVNCEAFFLIFTEKLKIFPPSSGKLKILRNILTILKKNFYGKNCFFLNFRMKSVNFKKYFGFFLFS